MTKRERLARLGGVGEGDVVLLIFISTALSREGSTC